MVFVCGVSSHVKQARLGTSPGEADDYLIAIRGTWIPLLTTF